MIRKGVVVMLEDADEIELVGPLVEAFVELTELYEDAPWPSDPRHDLLDEYERQKTPGRETDWADIQARGGERRLGQMASDIPFMGDEWISFSDGSSVSMTFPTACVQIPLVDRRTMFMTEHGYIGLSSNMIEEKDEVILIEGGTALFIFAPSGEVAARVARMAEVRAKKTVGGWMRSVWNGRGAKKLDPGHVESAMTKRTLVGEAYVHGVMNGELAETLRSRVEVLSIV
ncbi:hypothetical protein F4782DRAFT_534703 [Xylaria castorea]|nr:hypothetical protein F4782DRAFT_534703 [Xylaria castorea]